MVGMASNLICMSCGKEHISANGRYKEQCSKCRIRYAVGSTAISLGMLTILCASYFFLRH